MHFDTEEATGEGRDSLENSKWTTFDGEILTGRT